MVAKTHTFTHSGTLNQAVIPAGTTSVDMYLWGGAGGAGGADAGGPGGSGAAGHHVKKLTYAIATSLVGTCLLYTSPSPRDQRGSRIASYA